MSGVIRTNFIDHTGLTVGCLTATQYLGKGEWLCRCICGRHKVIESRDFVRRPNTCSHKAARGTAVKRTPTLYGRYSSARSRCLNPNDPRYPQYGGRGIEFRFTSFMEFKSELGDPPTPDHSVDRINNDGHYEPGNVRWATRSEQARNQSHTLHLTVRGRTQCLSNWAEEVGLKATTLHTRLFKGWCVDCAVFQPLYGHCDHGDEIKGAARSVSLCPDSRLPVTLSKI